MLLARFLGCVCATTGLLIADALTSSVWAQAKMSFEIYGFAQADASIDTNRMDPAWDDAFRPSKIPTEPGTFGGDGQSSVSVKQSRFGVQGNLPIGEDLGPLNFRFEFDFFGVGVDAGQTTIRLRHFYGEWRSVLAGQTNSLFMDGDVFPNTIEYWGPTGMVFYRNVQLRWTPWRTPEGHFAVAIERPGNDIDPGLIRQFDPAFGDNIRNDEKLPDFTAQFRLNTGWGHAQVGGIVRRVGFETIGSPDGEPNGHDTGWGVNFSTRVNVFRRDRILAQLVVGQGIASYMNDGGMDLAPDGTLLDAHAQAVPLKGALLYLDHFWSERWSSSIGYSITQVRNTSLQGPETYHRGEYASVNLLYTPTPNFLVGLEAIWGQRTDNDGRSADDSRFQFSVKYSFSRQFEL
jgi:hypothetical protein